MRRIVTVTLIIIVGIVVGTISWKLTPLNWKLGRNTHYMIRIAQAEDLRQKGDMLNAEAELYSAIRLLPTRYEAYLNLGDILLEKGNTNAALDNYNLALRYCGSSPTNVLPHELQERERNLIVERISELSTPTNAVAVP
jgi:tetratricopeptide (TPR) repeat protein